MSGGSDFQKQFGVSRETIDRLSDFEQLLRKWTAKINLISKSTLDDVWQRHFVDSAQVFQALPDSPTKISDFGSGGGFPGIIVAIMNAELQPESHVTLIESDVRKSSFLSTAVRELELNATVTAERVEAVASLQSDIVTARALAALDVLLPFAKHHLKEDASCLFLKGASFQKEVDQARIQWNFDLDILPSLTHPEAALLHIKNLRSKQ